MQRIYKDIIFTDHALKRLKRRRISQDMVVKTVKSPEKREKADNGNIRFEKHIQDRKVHVIANYLPDEKRWLIVSAWVRGEDDPRPWWVHVLLAPVTLFRWITRQRK